MIPEYSPEPPDRLLEQAKLSGPFRRRAVLAKANGEWELLCCTVEGSGPDEKVFEPTQSRKYRQAVLHEDFLTTEECLRFMARLQAGHANFGDISLKPHQNRQWSTHAVPVNNDYMACTGYVVGLSFGQDRNRTPIGALLAPGQPYYPDIYEAARDWLPFTVYHGDNDGRNNQVFFLLPETRAYIAGASFSEIGTLDIVVGGTDIARLPLLVKGAYWIGKSIHHFDAEVSESKAALIVPTDVDRLEYYLLDRTGTVYGFHREDKYSQFKLGGNVIGSAKRKLLDQVHDAINQGEGMHVEFKPFVDPEQKHDIGGQKTKLHEIITTVVAFSNTAGGNIYLGIDDDCSITGIDRKLGEWAKSAIDESTVNRYIGALRSKIKDALNGEVTLRLSSTSIDGALVVAIEVPEAASKPITIRQDNYLYARIGASNRKVPPDQWKAVLASDKLEDFNLRDRF
jgi:hypothetical protein